MAAPSRLQTISGYFLPRNQQDQEMDDEDCDLSDEEDWKDFDDLNGGASGLSAKPLKKEKLLFNETSGRQYTLVGQFPLTDPWFQARVKVRQNNYTRKFVVGYPSYSIRADSKLATDGVISLFLEACGIDTNARMSFMDFVRNIGADSQLNFDNLREYIEMFGGQDTGISNHIMTYMLKLIEESAAGSAVWSMKKSPLVSQYLPQLLPRCYKALCSDTSLVEMLEETLDEKPWVFAFFKVAKAVTGVAKEATLMRYENCDSILEGVTQPYKDAMYIYDVLKTMSHKDGHTFVEKKGLQTSRLFKDYKPQNFDAGLEFLRREKIVTIEEKNGVEKNDVARVFLSYLHAAEKGIAEDVLAMFQHAQTQPWILTLDTESPDFSRILQDKEQYAAAKLIATRPIVCISGKGGCGKTTVVSTVIAQQDLGQPHSSEPVVLLTAPTGKAANLLGKRSRLPGFTLHSVVCSYRSWQARLQDHNNKTNKTTPHKQPDGDNTQKCTQSMNTSRHRQEDGKELGKEVGKELGEDDREDDREETQRGRENVTQNQDEEEPRWKFCRVRVLVVDECSLVGVKLFHALLHCLLAHSRLEKLILLGDVNQLPSIEPGYFLGDLYEGLSRLGCSITLTTNHRAEAELIVSNATAIANRCPPVIDATRNFHHIKLSSSRGDSSYEQDAAVQKLLKSQVPGINIQDHHSTQFVAFRRKDCEAINEKCSLHYARHSLLTPDKKRDFRVGDKVCCTKNGDVSVKEMYTAYESYLDNTPSKSPAVQEEGSEAVKQTQKRDGKASDTPTTRLSNGEIFFIVDDVSQQSSSSEKPERYLVLHDPDRSGDADHYMKLSYRELRRNCKLRHAWARTIHTYQGSESSTVVYVVGSAHNQTWQHVYTAVTRGRREVVLLGDPRDLQRAVATKPRPRNTMLRQRLGETLRPGDFSFPGLQTETGNSGSGDSGTQPESADTYCWVDDLFCNTEMERSQTGRNTGLDCKMDCNTGQQEGLSESQQDSSEFSDWDDDTNTALLQDENLQSPQTQENGYSKRDDLDSSQKAPAVCDNHADGRIPRKDSKENSGEGSDMFGDDFTLSDRELAELTLASGDSNQAGIPLQASESKDASHFTETVHPQMHPQADRNTQASNLQSDVPPNSEFSVHGSKRRESRDQEDSENDDSDDDFEEWDPQMSQAVVDVMDSTTMDGRSATSSIPNLTSSLPNPTSSLPNPTSSLPNPTSSLPNPTSSLPNPTSSLPNPMSSLPNPTSTLPNPTSSLPNPTSTLPNPTSSLPNPTSSLPNPTSSLPNPTSSLPNPTSSLPNPTSSLPNPTSSLPNPTSSLPNPTSSIPNPSSSLPNGVESNTPPLLLSPSRAVAQKANDFVSPMRRTLEQVLINGEQDTPNKRQARRKLAQ